MDKGKCDQPGPKDDLRNFRPVVKPDALQECYEQDQDADQDLFSWMPLSTVSLTRLGVTAIKNPRPAPSQSSQAGWVSTNFLSAIETSRP
jgi:hypothetical protein